MFLTINGEPWFCWKDTANCYGSSLESDKVEKLYGFRSSDNFLKTNLDEDRHVIARFEQEDKRSFTLVFGYSNVFDTIGLRDTTPATILSLVLEHIQKNKNYYEKLVEDFLKDPQNKARLENKEILFVPVSEIPKKNS